MKGNPLIIETLNKVLGDELIAINQYFLHARMFRNWGLEVLDKADYKKSIEDMKHADALTQRIFFLEGLPNLQKLGKLRIGENTAEILHCNYQLQVHCIEQLKQAIELCEREQDYISRQLLEKLLDDEEEQLDWLEEQTDLLNTMGLENYQQANIKD